MKLAVSLLSMFILSGVLMAQTHSPTGFPPQIKHVVVIFQENRTPDNLFQFLTPKCPIPQGAKGLQACLPSPVTTSCYDISPCGVSNHTGKVLPIALTPEALGSATNDPSHAHTAFETMCDPNPDNGFACRNDGAWNVQNKNGLGLSYRYVDNVAVTNYDGSSGHLLDPYLTFAKQYGWANFMYQTNQGPSYPAHQYIFSGTSGRSATEDLNSTFISENFKPKGSSAGCLALANVTTSQVLPLPPGSTLCPGGKAFDSNSVQECTLANTDLNNPPGNPVGSFCTSKQNMGAVLDQTGVTWKYYAPGPGSIWTAPNSIQNICVPKFNKKQTKLNCTGTEWTANVDLTLKGANVLNDISDCKLASVSWVIPNGKWSDHPGDGNQYGPSWVAAVINSIGQNPMCAAGTPDAGETFWNNTAIIVTWDDWGGWSDNQPAPILSGLPCLTFDCQGDYQLGFRVPLFVVSAYTPQGLIDNNNYDFGSILRTIQGIYGIPEGTLGVADARSSTDLSNFFTGAFRPYVFVPAEKAPSFFLGAAQKGKFVPPDNDGDDD